jgi:hypothetical protein
MQADLTLFSACPRGNHDPSPALTERGLSDAPVP